MSLEFVEAGLRCLLYKQRFVFYLDVKIKVK